MFRVYGGGRNALCRLSPNFLEEDIRDIITCFKFGDDRFRGLASAEGQILPFPIDFDGRPYNTLTLPWTEKLTACHQRVRCVIRYYL